VNGTLEDVFEISGRGAVALVKIDDGYCLTGDNLVVGGKAWPITGIEMVKYNDEGMRRMAEGWVPPIGILLSGALKVDLVEWVGSSVETVEQRKSKQ
jgi:translation elongation factor EF-Tu-like GTPase